MSYYPWRIWGNLLQTSRVSLFWKTTLISSAAVIGFGASQLSQQVAHTTLFVPSPAFEIRGPRLGRNEITQLESPESSFSTPIATSSLDGSILQATSETSLDESSTSSSNSDTKSGNIKVLAIVFGSVGALAALAVCYLCARSICSYIRTPKRDRTAEVIHRQQLEQELAESHFSKQVSLPLPPPPYERAPDYEHKPKPL